MILVLTSTLPRWPDDTEPRFVLDLCARLNPAFRVVALAPHARGAARHEVLEGVEIHRFRYAPGRWEVLAYDGGVMPKLKSRPWTWLLVPLLLAAETLACARLLRREPVAVLHAHWLIPQAFCGWLACVLARRRSPLVCTVHGADVFSLRGGLFNALRRFAIRRCAWLGAVSAAVAAELARLGAESGQLRLLPMGVSEPAGAQARARDLDHIVFAGRLVEKKGVPVLLRAYAQLRAQGGRARLTIAGAGPELAACRALASELGVAEHVRFTGAIPQPEILRLFQQATVAVMPSIVAADGDTEGLGLVALEAMMCGCPVIVSDLPATRTYLRDGENGWLFPAGDPVALAKTLQSVLADASVLRRVGDAGREYARAKFGWTAAAEAYAGALRAAMPQ